MNSFPSDQVLAACAKYGPLLDVAQPLLGPQVMAAIAMVESSMGVNCGPRHEPAYDVGGSICESSPEQQSLVAQFGSDAASSFGPWQLMFINCPGYTPEELETNPDGCARAFVSYFNAYVIRAKKAQTLAEIGEVFNAGHIISGTLPPGVERYVEALQNAYEQVHIPTEV